MQVQKIAQASRPRKKLVECISVARVRPRTSKGITDLLWLNLVRLRLVLLPLIPLRRYLHGL